MGIISGAKGTVKTIETVGMDGEKLVEFAEPIQGIGQGINHPPIVSAKADTLQFEVKPMPKRGQHPRDTPYAYAGWVGKNIILNSHSTDFPGQQFNDLRPGEVIYVKDKSGNTKPYILGEKETFRYDVPASPYRGGLKDKYGHHYDWNELGRYLEHKPDGSIILHVSATTSPEDKQAYGTHFITAVPAPETYGNQPPTTQVKAQRK